MDREINRILGSISIHVGRINKALHFDCPAKRNLRREYKSLKRNVEALGLVIEGERQCES